MALISFTLEGPCLGQSAACEPILRALPDWFGVESKEFHQLWDASNPCLVMVKRL